MKQKTKNPIKQNIKVTGLAVLLFALFSLLGLSQITPNQSNPKLPAKFEKAFDLTIYYTPKESGFPAGELRTIELFEGSQSVGTTQVNNAFRLQSNMEGTGEMVSAVNQKRIIVPKTISATPPQYWLYSVPVGNAANPLTPKASSAADQSMIRRGMHVRVASGTVSQAFGNDLFRVDDVGGAIKGYKLDLYWDIDNPSANDPNLLAGTTWTGESGVTVYRVASPGS